MSEAKQKTPAPKGSGAESEKPEGRGFGGRFDVAASSVLAIVIALLVNYLAFRHYERFDWTAEGLFSVSERTESVVRGLSRPVTVYLFMGEGEPGFSDLRDLARSYTALNERVEVEHVDPDREPQRYQLLAERFEISAVTGPGGVSSDVAAVVVSGDRRWRITRDDLLSLEFDQGAARAVNVQSERALTGAILEVTEGRPTRMCATTGHGEREIDAGGPRGLLTVAEELDRDNVELEPFRTLGASRVPEGCDAVLVLGPQSAFSEEEAELLFGYLRAGGHLLLALDPVIRDDRVEPSGFETHLAELGVLLDRSMVLELDPDRLLTPNPLEAFLVTEYGDHATTERLAAVGAPTLLMAARSVRAEEGSDATVLMRTTAEGYAETDLAQLLADGDLEPGPGDLPGPVPLALALEIETADADAEAEAEEEQAEPAAVSEGGRLIVVGDSDFLEGQAISAPQFANIDLLGSIVGWLGEREALISIAPRTSDVVAVMMTDGDLTGVFIRVVLLLPLAMVLLGVSVWWGRRS